MKFHQISKFPKRKLKVARVTVRFDVRKTKGTYKVVRRPEI